MTLRTTCSLRRAPIRWCIWPLLTVATMLASCATTEEKFRYMDELAEAQITASRVSDFEFTAVDFDRVYKFSLGWYGTDVFDFGNGKSFFKAFAVPSVQTASIDLVTLSTFTYPGTAHIVYPTINEYDENFKLVRKSNGDLTPTWDFFSGMFFELRTTLATNTRYVAIFADPEHFGGTTDYQSGFMGLSPNMTSMNSDEEATFGPGGPMRVTFMLRPENTANENDSAKVRE